MNILYYDCFSGISGDMNLGAMIDLGVDKNYLINELTKLNIDGYSIEIKKALKNGIQGTKVDVLLHNHEHEHTHTHCHRNLNDIQKIINSSSLNEKVKKLSLDMFKKVAEAEAKVHGKSITEVHFHEVGAIDSIIDIVGAAICFDYLNVDKIISSTVELGKGFVECAHGIIPVPAPATVEILKGIPVKSGIIPFEATTPTGAAILAVNASDFTDNTDFVIEKIGYGVGNRDGKIPNVLRVFLGKKIGQNDNNQNNIFDVENEYIIECNIDDMNPEIYSYVVEKLFACGASDVYMTNILMKKGRPSIKLSVLCNKNIEDKVKEILFKETSTLGVRKYEVQKNILKRENSIIETKFGNIRLKKAYWGNKVLKSKLEYEDCRRISEKNNIPLIEVYRKFNYVGNEKEVID